MGNPHNKILVSASTEYTSKLRRGGKGKPSPSPRLPLTGEIINLDFNGITTKFYDRTVTIPACKLSLAESAQVVELVKKFWAPYAVDFVANATGILNVAIGGDGSVVGYAGYGGVTEIGSFLDGVGSSFVNSDCVGPYPEIIARDINHEMGHGAGIEGHDYGFMTLNVWNATDEISAAQDSMLASVFGRR
jgi:hypothetical protein